MANWWDKYPTVKTTEENWWDKYPTVGEELPTGGFFPEFGKGVVRGSLNVGAGITGTLETFAKAEVTPFRGFAPPEHLLPPKEERAKPFRKAKEKIQEAREKFPVTHSGAAAWTGRVVGEAIPYMGAALAAGYAVGPIGAAAVGFSVEGQNAYDEAIESGASEGQAQTDRIVVGSINAAIEALQIGRLMKFHQTGKHSLKSFIQLVRNKAWKKAGKQGLKFGSEILKLSVEEGLEEFSQEGVSLAVPAILRGQYPQKEDGTPDWWAIGERLGEATLGGAVAGGILGGAGAVRGLGRTPGVTPIVPTEPTIPVEKITPTEEDITTPEVVEDIKRNTVIEENPDVTPEEMEATLKAESDTVLKDKIGGLLEAVERREAPAIAEAKEEKRKEVGRRFGAAREITRTGGERELHFIAKRELFGEYPKAPEFTPIQELGVLTPDEITRARILIRTDPTLLDAESINAEDALNKFLEDGVVPTDSEIRLLERTLGTKTADALKKLKGKSRATISRLIDNLNAARTLKASMDLSFGGRQGIVMATTHPVLWSKAVVTGWRIFLSKDVEKFAEQIDFDLRTSKYYRLSQESGIDLTDWRGPITKREEQFQSTLFTRLSDSKIPVLREVARLIKRSNIAFTTNANKFRMDVFSHWASRWEGTGQSKDEYKHLAKFINHATGRADLKWFADIAPALNATFFSPQFRASRFLLPVDAVMEVYRSGRTGEWTAASQMMFSNLAGFVGSGLLALGLFSMIPGVDVEYDPRSADFGKIRYGDMRIDFWAGYTPIARLAAQLMTGERKVTDTGKIQGVDAGDVLWRYLRSGFSPPVSLATNLLTGKNWIGEEMELTASSVGKSIGDLLAPLALWDMYEAFKNQGLIAGSVSVPLAFHGIGVQTYPISPSKQSYLTKDLIAQQVYGEKWDNLGPLAQKLLRENRPQIELAEMKARAERERPPYLAKMLEEQFKVGQRLQKNLPKDIRNELDRLMIQTGGLSRRMGGDWWLNDKRYKTYQKDVSNGLNRVLSRIVRHRNWIRLSDGQKRELLEEVIDMSKKRARQQLIRTAELKDLIDTKELAR